METNDKARNAIINARTALILDQPFFGVLALKLRIEADPTCATAWVDGCTLGYSPEFVSELRHAEVVALIAQEVMHCACGHPWRRDSRDPKQWNVACDYAINHVVSEAGFSLPKGALRDAQYDGQSAEWIYARLPQPQEDGQQGGGQGEAGDGEGQPGPPSPQGEVRDAPADTEADGTSEAEWRTAVQQAAKVAEGQGKLPGGAKRFAEDSAQSAIDWRSALRRFVQETARADYTWRRPSARYLSRGLYLPALHSEQLGEIVVAVDTSGSIDQVMLAQFASELRAILEDAQPSAVTVMYCDTQVHTVERFDNAGDFELNAVGGGGTAFAPVFAAVEDMDEQPVCVIYLTDLLGTFPSEPDVPVLWAATGKRTAPWGETIPVN